MSENMNVSMSETTDSNLITNNRLYTVEEMSAYLGVKVGTLKDWTKLKENPCPCLRYKTRTLRFEPASVMAWFKAQTEAWSAPRKND